MVESVRSERAIYIKAALQCSVEKLAVLKQRERKEGGTKPAAAVMSSVSPLFQQLLQLGRLPPFESLDGSESCFDALDLRFGPTCNQCTY